MIKNLAFSGLLMLLLFGLNLQAQETELIKWKEGSIGHSILFKFESDKPSGEQLERLKADVTALINRPDSVAEVQIQKAYIEKAFQIQADRPNTTSGYRLSEQRP